jgi:hypothetical protein
MGSSEAEDTKKRDLKENRKDPKAARKGDDRDD